MSLLLLFAGGEDTTPTITGTGTVKGAAESGSIEGAYTVASVNGAVEAGTVEGGGDNATVKGAAESGSIEGAS